MEWNLQSAAESAMTRMIPINLDLHLQNWRDYFWPPCSAIRRIAAGSTSFPKWTK